MVAHRDSSHLQTQVGCWAWADGCPFGIQLRAQRLAVSNISSSGGSRRKRGGLSLLAFLSPGVPDLSICWICPWASIMGPPPDGSRTISVDGYQSPEGEQEQRKKKRLHGRASLMHSDVQILLCNLFWLLCEQRKTEGLTFAVTSSRTQTQYAARMKAQPRYRQEKKTEQRRGWQYAVWYIEPAKAALLRDDVCLDIP